MTPPARLSAAISILDAILSGQPAEAALRAWGKASRFAGSGDRHAIRDLVFESLRRKRSAAAMGGSCTGRGLILGLLRLQGAGIDLLFSGENHAPSRVGDNEAPREPTLGEGLDCPDWLLPVFQSDLGDQFVTVMSCLQSRAKVFVRINNRKATAASAISALAQDGIVGEVDEEVPSAIEIIENARKINSSRAYLDGLVELQDISSQFITQKLPLQNGQKILDYCAGGGGKTLAMAARVDARFFAYDFFAYRMRDLPDRTERAGVSVQILQNPAQAAPYDLVLCDVPCSGSGSWRRDPQGKWALTPQKLNETYTLQSEILDQGASLVQPEGVLCYATCSILRSENEDQIARFLELHPDWHCTWEQRVAVSERGDGFFVAHLRRRLGSF